MEILLPNQYAEYEEFVSNHPRGTLTQSVLWHGVKENWDHEIVVLRDNAGKIKAGINILIRRVPGIGTAMMYAPRGPICDYDSQTDLEGLQKGIDEVAKKHKAHIFKMDPDVNVGDTDFVKLTEAMGYTLFAEPTGFETIQTRFNYRLYIDGRNEEAILMNMHHKTRYNIRLAGRRGVTVEVGTKDDLDEFMRLMKITGERDGFAIRSKSYFETMLRELGEHVRMYMAYYEGQAVAGAITSNYAGKTEYIYGCSDNEHRNTMATYLIQWEMIRWALETDCTVYDFMGISGDMSEDNPLYGLYRFKDGFTGVVDEAIGEMDYVYKPVVNKLVDVGISLNDWVRDVGRQND